MADDWTLKDLIGAVKADQATAEVAEAKAAMLRLAQTIAAFYGGLVESGIPQETAGVLTREFQHYVVSAMIGGFMPKRG